MKPRPKAEAHTSEEQLAREKTVTGRVQLQAFYHDEKHELVVSVFAADDLASRAESGYGSLPEAYVQLRLLPFSGEQCAVKTEVASPSHNPLWNTTVEIKNVSGEVMDKTIEVTLWDARPDKEQVFLGECTVDLTKSLMEDCPVWYRLEDPRRLRSGGKPSPRSSLVGEVNTRLLARGNHSLSEERDSEDGDGVGSFLHPDHAYTSGSRRGSSQSEQLEVETYQLSEDTSRSLPGSRRSSFQKEGEKQEAEQPMPVYSRERRRSSVARRDPDEILRSLKAVKGELLGRSMSICIDKHGQCRGGAGKNGRGRKGSMMAGVERTEPLFSCSSPSDDEDKSTPYEAKTLGPGQVQPRGHKFKSGGQAEIKLSLLMTKGQLEVEVICVRGIQGDPDTYVKTYLRDGERWLQKRKTKVVRHTNEPIFHQTLHYSACDVLGRSLVIMLWEKQKGFEHNIGLGGAEVAFNKIKLTQVTQGWYPLFPIQTLGSDSNDSP